MHSTQTVVSFIASGLIKWQHNYEKNNSYYPMPEELKRGINMLAAIWTEDSKDYPKDNHEIIKFLSNPISSWGLDKGYGFEADEALLQYGELTDLCYELAVDNKNIEEELTQKVILDVMNTCRAEEDQQGYVNFRKKIIENPILKKEELINWANDIASSSAADLLKEFYEDIPIYAVNRDGAVYKCSYCGWTVEWDKDGNGRCHNSLCHQYTNNFRKIKKLKEEPKKLVRLKRGCMRYLAKPGKYELILKEKLLKLGLKVELWPNFDLYDLKVIFPDGEIWAVDMKDYSNPDLLVARLGSFPEEAYYNKAFYVIPQYRYSFNPTFERVFENTYKYKKENLQLFMENNFLKQVKEKLGGDF